MSTVRLAIVWTVLGLALGYVLGWLTVTPLPNITSSHIGPQMTVTAPSPDGMECYVIVSNKSSTLKASK